MTIPHTSSERTIWWYVTRTLLEKAMATHSSSLAWTIPLTEEPGRLPSMGSQRTGHEWVTALWLFLCLTVDNFCQHIFKFTSFFSVIPSLFLSSSQEFFIYGIIFHLALPFGFLCSFYLFLLITRLPNTQKALKARCGDLGHSLEIKRPYPGALSWLRAALILLSPTILQQ